MALLKGRDYISAEDGVFKFTLGIRKPRPGQNEASSSFMTVLTSDAKLSTSGDYDHAFFVDGIRYCHIFDPRTGFPINTPIEAAQRGFAAATVIGRGGAYVEALSTGLLVMSPKEAITFINEKLRGYKVVLVYYKTGYDFFEIITNIPGEQIKILDPAYIIASQLDYRGNIEYTGTLAPLAPGAP
jgi:thiamine biosynthesis lipoprotein ApbE